MRISIHCLFIAIYYLFLLWSIFIVWNVIWTNLTIFLLKLSVKILIVDLTIISKMSFLATDGGTDPKK